MNILISDKIYINNPTTELKKWILENLIVINPTYATLKRLGKEDIIRFKHIPEKMDLYSIKGTQYALPFGIIKSIWPLIRGYDIKTSFNNHGIVMNQNIKISQPLYDYQEEAVDAMLRAKGGVLVSKCGSGKTNISIALIHSIGKRFLFLVHTNDLLKQFYSRAKLLFPYLDIGIISEGKYNVGKHGAVATIQTMANLDKDLYKEDFDVVIVDECVHVNGSPTLSKMFFKVLNNIPARYKFGLTATPYSSNGIIKTMYTNLGCNSRGEFAPEFTVDRLKVKTMDAEHVMVPLDTEMSYDALNLDGTFDYSKLIDYLSENTVRNDIILSKIEENVSLKRKQLVLCSRVSHCEYLHQKLLEKGIKSELLVGKVSTKKRESILTAEKDKWDVIVASYSLAKEGLDVPILDTLHFTMPQKDKALVVQSVGRIERVCEGKNNPIVLDYVDTEIPYCLGAYKKRKSALKKRI